MKSKRRIIFIGILAIILLFLILIFRNSSKEDKPQDSGVSNSSLSQTIKEKPKKSLGEISNEKIENAFIQLKKYESGFPRTEVKDILEEVTTFKDVFFVIDAYDSIFIDSIRIKTQSLKKKLLAIQKKEFPLMRKDYGIFAASLLWENDIEVRQNGTSITFIGGIFSSNKNIKDFYSELEDMFFKLRFKRINFKWSEGAEKYTYYTPSTPKDSEFIYY